MAAIASCDLAIADQAAMAVIDPPSSILQDCSITIAIARRKANLFQLAETAVTALRVARAAPIGSSG